MIRALMIVLVSVALACCATLPCAAGHDKKIALTFDDVPREPGAFMTMAERQKRLIAALKLAHVRRVAFFTNPGHLDRAKSPDYPEPIMAYANAGHIIANHSFTHSALSNVSVQAYLEDVDRADTWLRGRKNFRPWYRFPYLDEGGDDVTKRDAVRAALKARGLFDAAITVDGWDWNMEERTVEAVKTGKLIDRAALKDMFVTAYVDEAECADALGRRLLGRAPAQVMLLHEADVTTMFLGDLVKSLRTHGWKIVSPDTSYRDPIYRIKTKESPAEGPLLTELAQDRGIDTPTTCRWNDDAFANSEFDRRVLHRPS